MLEDVNGEAMMEYKFGGYLANIFLQISPRPTLIACDLCIPVIVLK